MQETFVKKPLTIMAEQFWPDVEPWPDGVFMDQRAVEGAHGPIPVDGPRYFVRTPNGEVEIAPGEYIAIGAKGEHYPIRSDILAETYWKFGACPFRALISRYREIARKFDEMAALFGDGSGQRYSSGVGSVFWQAAREIEEIIHGADGRGEAGVSGGAGCVLSHNGEHVGSELPGEVLEDEA